ncbi:MAG: cyclohexadienyl dehydrogenase [Candidatus Pelagibacter sp. TMED128]|nr:MAG: cyclohexadienyl dehydrogenase [Candidatus Pelagibacter sp. TMED128]|tara:strand:- start:742 stop:1638 length:897 start_codon:yes stop_codon:yes gene_type:complete
MFNKITIIGCGLIGSSILRIVDKKKLSKQINIFDKSKEASVFIKNNFSVEVFNDLSESVIGSDLIIIASPLSSYKEILLSIKSNLKENVILTDTGSAKKEVNKIISNLNLDKVHWISSHPIAGTEFSGPESGFVELFKDRWCILSSEDGKETQQFSLLKKFWEALGTKVKFMSFEDHDYVLSLTSHLPHAIAYSIIRTVIKNDDKFKDEIIQYSASGLRDFTRIAASDPIMWRDIFIDNSENILKVLDNFSENLEEIKKAIQSKNSKKLNNIFSSTRKLRKDIIKAGQETDKPNFGRK